MSFVETWTSSCASLTAFFRRREKPAAEAQRAPIIEAIEPEHSEQAAASGAQSLVDEMLSLGRYALLLRPQLIANLTGDQFNKAQAAMAEGMCLIPQGEVGVQRHPDFQAHHETQAKVHPIAVGAYYLDRLAVTNDEYQKFVAAGGYEQMSLWDPEIWAALLDFVDHTGHPGPRYWRNGRFARGEGRHPVVGVSWYEAAAFARWAGKRLPTDAEWVKAACWPVSIPGHPLLQRRYPWGEAIDRQRANLWGSGVDKTVGVDEFREGASVGGPQQLIGNVWEWTTDLFIVDPNAPQDPDQPKMNSLRGGAFDTYLDCQSTCHFQSGDRALARKHNIGFRCAISVGDIAQAEDADGDATDSSAPARSSDTETAEHSLQETHV